MALFGICSMSAQKGEMSAGLNISYGTEISSIGIGAKYQYGITDVIRGEASFNYFIENNCLSMWDINLTAHYLFNISDKINVYPLAGLTYTRVKYEWVQDIPDEYKDTVKPGTVYANGGKFGVNIGGGAEYSISKNLTIGAELKYTLISTWDQAVVSIGVTYKF